MSREVSPSGLTQATYPNQNKTFYPWSHFLSFLIILRNILKRHNSASHQLSRWLHVHHSVCAHTPPAQPTPTDIRAMIERRLWKQTWKKKSILSGESWDRSQWAGERILEKWKCCAGGHPEATLTWVIYDLFQLWTCAWRPSGPDVLLWCLCCIAHEIKTGLEF